MSHLPEHSENIDEEMHRVRLALDAVFSPQTPTHEPTNWWEQRQLADRYLTSFQGTTLAWMVCDRLLQENSSTTHRFFAAQTLHTKCRADVFQLPSSSLASLRDSLLVHLGTYSTIGDAALTNRLAMAVSALAVQMPWTSIVADLLSAVNTEPQKRNIVMQLFKVLPEECASDRLLLIDENERYYMRDHFVSMSADVFRFIQSWDGSPNVAYEVLFTWIRHVPIQSNVLTGSPLLEAAFHSLLNQETMELAADVIVEAYRMYPSYVPCNRDLVQRMFPLSSNLPFEQALASNDEDVLRTYCRVITEMAESYMSLIFSTQFQEGTKLVELVLRCSAIPEIEISSITLHFWYRMVMELETIEPYEFRQDLIDQYTPYLLQLIDMCSTNLMKYPSDVSDLSEDELDDVYRNRFYVSETVEDCCRLVGGHIVLDRLGNQLRNQVHLVGTNLSSNWQEIESCLMCILSINKFIPSDEAAFLPIVFELIQRLPPDIQPLRCTTSKLIGKYALWLIGHPHLLQPLMPFIAQGLSIPSCSAAAALSIKELCECSNQKMAIGEPVLELYMEITATPGQLALKDELEVLEGVCRAISRQVQETRVDGSSFVQRIVQPIGNRLSAKAADPNSKPKKDIIPELDRLTTIVRFLTISSLSASGSSPIVDIIQSVWPILDALSTRYPLDIAIAEKICRLHKHALRSCGVVAYEPMLEPLMKQLIQSYERSRQSAYLYAASICVTEYGRDPKHGLNLFGMINAMASVSFSFLKSLDDFTRHPDVVEELFYMMGRMVTHCPIPLVMSPLLRSLFQCAAVGMQLDHREANKGTLNFLENSISSGVSAKEQNNLDCQQALERVLADEGQSIVNNLVLSLTGDLQAYNVDAGNGSIAGILWKLQLFSPGMMIQWITVALGNAPERARMEFVGVMKGGVPRKDFDLAVRGFMNACKKERRFATKK
jgi:transportin-3